MREHKKYCLFFDMGDSCDGIEFDDFDEAKYEAFEILSGWICDEQGTWFCDENGKPHISQGDIESWDCMIDDCSVYIAEWNDKYNEFFDPKGDYWYPSDEDYNKIGWLYWEELKEKYGWHHDDMLVTLRFSPDDIRWFESKFGTITDEEDLKDAIMEFVTSYMEM